MRVNWITCGYPQRAANGGLTSDLASLRYRVLSPVHHLRAGFQHKLVPITPEGEPPPLDAVLDADLLVFSKSQLASNETLAQAAKARSIAVVFDVCDNHYDHPELGGHYRRMSALADRVVCSSPELATLAEPHCVRPPAVVEDPYEGPRGAPNYAPGERLNLLWFGHPSNLESLRQSLTDLVAHTARRPISLVVLTQVNAALEAIFQRVTDRHAPAFEMRARPWSLEAQWREIAACEAVIIPSLANPTTQAKSANRMVEALWAGRPAVAQPIPAYRPFGAWMALKPTLAEGLDWLDRSAAEIPERIGAAQDYIAQRHAPAVLAAQWGTVLTDTHQLEAR